MSPTSDFTFANSTLLVSITEVSTDGVDSGALLTGVKPQSWSRSYSLK